MHPTLVILAVGLSPALVGAFTPNLQRLAARGALRPLDTVVPAVTCTVQSTLLTGLAPSGHGIVANGWYFRDLSEVWLWRQSNRLVAGEKVWELPMYDEYKDLTKGTITDLVNSSDKRKAGVLYAASFLEEFVDGIPWVHLDIAGTAWDVGREYASKGATGYGVRLLVDLARDLERR